MFYTADFLFYTVFYVPIWIVLLLMLLTQKAQTH